MNGTFAENLAQLRAKKGLTQRELGAAAGIAWSMVSKYESGQSIPRLKILMRLADALGVSKEDLAGDPPKDKRLTLDIPPEVSDQLKQVAEETGKTFEEVVTEVLEWGIKRFDEDPEFAANVLKGVEARRHEDS
ncbi:XRE family transcriptional regulator [Pseudomonas sp. FBF18]|uniref:helix-turn-helix transcriptional regulator n=1 Tax=Pseudomonas TaxID=286 RepID=UPI0006D448C8|nr:MULTISPECIES: helix-turn-helix transcriptional regulator [Pseudomonas]MCP8350649.1 XRE family transcriptional regulator [Pseudomonas sp. FBF18]